MATFDAAERVTEASFGGKATREDREAAERVGSGGNEAVEHFTMRGRTAGGSLATWSVTTSPDWTGAQAPEAVTDVVLIKQWTA